MGGRKSQRDILTLGVERSLLHEVAIGLIDGVGDVIAKQLIAYCGGAENVFREPEKHLLTVPGVGVRLANAIRRQDVLARAEEELRFIEHNDITPVCFLDENYPERLKFCEDGPVMLYTRGKVNLNPSRVLAVIGTRNATSYGKAFCEQFIEDMVDRQITVISGLAYGIDITAHRACLKHGIPTQAVLAHGLDRMYPPTHWKTAVDMEYNGGVITEFRSGTNPDREHFPQRNRIVAGMADAVLVIESRKKGGALITAQMAFDYGREVFAVPGKVGGDQSEGCNRLIKTNRAALFEGIADLEYFMGWEKVTAAPAKSPSFTLPADLTTDQSSIVSLLHQRGELPVEELCTATRLPMHTITANLLELEFTSVVKSLPGNVYALS